MSLTPATLEPASDARERRMDLALARSVVYRALTLGLRHPSFSSLTSLAAGRPALLEAAALLDRSCLAAEPLLPAVQVLADRAGAAPGNAAGLAAAHARLFGHSQGLVCPFETEYGSGGSFRQPQELADIAGFYLAFGLRPATGADERADHVACECAFMDFLARKEAYVLASEPDGIGAAEAEEMHDVIRAAAASFLRDHLGRFGTAFATRLARAAEGDLFGALGGVLARLLALECERMSVPAGPPTLQVRPPAVDDVPAGCGTACDAEPDPIRIEIRERP